MRSPAKCVAGWLAGAVWVGCASAGTGIAVRAVDSRDRLRNSNSSRPDAGTTASSPQQRDDSGVATPVPSDAAAEHAPTAVDRVRSAVAELPVIGAAESAWFPLRVLEAAARGRGDLPATTAPIVAGDAMIWSVVWPPTARTNVSEHAPVCDDLTRADPRIACAVDQIEIGATDRVRLTVGWRRGPGEIAVDLATPLRALVRIGSPPCLVSAERTLHTIDVTLRAADLSVIGRALALMAAAPRMSDVLMVRSEPAAGGLEVLLSWPTDRADRTTGNLASDAWPSRCEARPPLGAQDPPRGPVSARALIRGERVQGAVVSFGRHEWIVTEGDHVGDAAITAVSGRGVWLRRGRNPRARATLIAFPRGIVGSPNASGLATFPAPPVVRPPVHVPLPPEPPLSSRP